MRRMPFSLYISLHWRKKKLAEKENTKEKCIAPLKNNNNNLKKNPDSIMTEEAMTLPSKQEKQVQNLPGKQILNGFRNFELILQSQRDHCCSDKTEKEHTHIQGK